MLQTPVLMSHKEECRKHVIEIQHREGSNKGDGCFQQVQKNLERQAEGRKNHTLWVFQMPEGQQQIQSGIYCSNIRPCATVQKVIFLFIISLLGFIFCETTAYCAIMSNETLTLSAVKYFRLDFTETWHTS